MAAHKAIIGIIHFKFRFRRNRIARRFLETDILSIPPSLRLYEKYIHDFTNSIIQTGYDKGIIIVFGGHKFIKITFGILSIIFGVFSVLY